MKTFQILLLYILTSNIKCETLATDKVPVNKCCPKYEIIVDSSCKHVNETDFKEWSPVFTNELGQDNIQVDFRYFLV